MQFWPVAHFRFVITFRWVQQQSNSKPTQKWWQNEKEKWTTGQNCIRKEVTSYKIHTLVEIQHNIYLANDKTGAVYHSLVYNY